MSMQGREIEVSFKNDLVLCLINNLKKETHITPYNSSFQVFFKDF